MPVKKPTLTERVARLEEKMALQTQGLSRVRKVIQEKLGPDGIYPNDIIELREVRPGVFEVVTVA